MVVTNSTSLKSTIIQVLSKEPMSLADLQHATHVSLPTLRNALQQLSTAGWVSTAGRSSSTGGRPATLFGLDDETYLVIGVHLEIPALNMVTSTLNGQVIDRVHLACQQKRLWPDEAIRQICAYIDRIYATYKQRRLLGVGLAVPGYIDPLSGRILLVREANWQEFPLKARLEAELDLPVIVENDVDCMTFAELAQTDTTDILDMLYLGFTEGVKVSIILNGHLYKGPYGNAGLLGRTVPSDPKSMNGSDEHRYLEEVASVGGVCRTFDKQVAVLSSRSDTLNEISRLTDHSEKFRAILAATEIEPLCNEIITGILDILVDEVVRLVYLLQPGQLIIGGALSHMQANLRTYMARSIRSKLPSLLNNHLYISYAKLAGSRVAAVGAAHRFLQDYALSEMV